MTVRTWNGGTAKFQNPNAWTPQGEPISGDFLLVPTGTVAAKHLTLDGLSFSFTHAATSGTTLPVFAIKNVTIGADSQIVGTNVVVPPGGPAQFVDGDGRIEASGYNVNQGLITARASGPFPGGSIELHLKNGKFVNKGTIESGILSDLSVTSGKGGVLKNDGLIDAGSGSMVIDAKVIGHGLIQLGEEHLQFLHGSPVVGWLDIKGFVGKNQTVEILQGGHLTIDDLSQFHADIKDFSHLEFAGGSSLETISLKDVDVTSFSYKPDEGAGVLTLRAGCEIVGRLSFLGDYTQSSFQITSGPGGSVLTLT